MQRALVLISITLASAPAAAQEFAPAQADGLNLGAGGGTLSDPVLERIFEPGLSRLTPNGEDGGLVGSTLDTLDALLTKLGIDRDELAEALAEVEVSGAEENWRDESSGEIGLSFGITDRLSVGPSFGLRHEEENLAGPDDEWSQQLKLGARFSF